MLGLTLLVYACSKGIDGSAWVGVKDMGITVFSGSIGLILFFYGIRLFIAMICKIGHNRPLHVYNFRQIQAVVIKRSTTLVISSLMILAAIIFLSAGISINAIRTTSNVHILDYTFKNKTKEYSMPLDLTTVQEELKAYDLTKDFARIISIKLGRSDLDHPGNFQHLLENLPVNREDKSLNNLKNILEHIDSNCFLINESGYNELRDIAGLKPLQLEKHEAALYIGPEFLNEFEIINQTLAKEPVIEFMGDKLQLIPDCQHLPLVTDRIINIATAIIIPDSIFIKYTNDDYSTYVSGVLQPDTIKNEGLMTAIYKTNAKLAKTNLGFESYIQNMGRYLFFTIAQSYFTIYFGLLFLIVANTMIGVLFLMEQRQSYRSYQTLTHVGADFKTLGQAIKKQINWYFGLPITTAVILSFFGTYYFIKGLMPTMVNNRSLIFKLLSQIPVICVLALIELIYIQVVKKNSLKYLLTCMQPQNED